MSMLSNFKRRGVGYQTLVAGMIFFLVYTLYLDRIGNPSLGESFLAAAIFASSYFVTSTVVLRRRGKRKE
ncbi:hypothetical protein P0O24_03510 [Methanotrichaceae archaeon M04Ac]|uniref:Uncharacterized protein n=1 Tax=Candidatus Methanocrinis alkalitolerans TaxID=3033395 RepID=A0ABT5XD77_9EURY|nr:hypothetical protein [Candidatus Methanocrinis alkalitolerans]MCR3884554.1 hypothetical protein [Methanothrix sp.]MDF0592646.1 hypothetical protein [Candidatus Methanocrinis alkalitolerans]